MNSAAEKLTELGALLIDGVPEIEPIPTNKIEADGWFDYQLRKLAGIEAQQESNNAIAQAEIRRQLAWCDSENAILENRAEYIRARMREAILGYDFGDKKTRRLPHGEFGRKKVPAKLVVDEAAAVIDWAKEYDAPDLIRVKQEVNKTELNKFVESTGLPVPGTHIEPESEQLIIKVVR